MQQRIDVQSVHRRGACPSAGAALSSGDGLLTRVRLPGGRIRARDLARVAELAECHGNGLLDLTRRGNLQIRGLTSESEAALTAELVQLRLAVEPPEAEGVRDIVGSPVADHDPDARLDPFPVIEALDRALSTTPDLWRLPPKFRFAVSGGGAHPASVDADLRADAVPGRQGSRYRLALAGTAATAHPLGSCGPEEAADALIALARCFLRLDAGRVEPARRLAELLPDTGVEPFRRLVSCPLDADAVVTPTVAAGPGPGAAWLALGVPFGRLTAADALRLAELARDHGDGTLRMTPERHILLPELDADGYTAVIEQGWITTPDDPLTALVACPGAPGCLSGTTATHDDARAWARAVPELFDGSIELHVSGCGKGCARSAPTPLTLTARDGAYELIVNDRPEPGDEDNRLATGLAPQAVTARLEQLAAGLRGERRSGEALADVIRRLGAAGVRPLVG